MLTYALAVALGAIAVWSYRQEAPLAAVASLMVTSLATANLTTTAVVRILHWISPEFGFVIVLLTTVVAFYGARWAKSPVTLLWSIILGNIFMWPISTINWQWGAEISQTITSLTALLLMTAAIAAWWNMGRTPAVAGFVLVGNLSMDFMALLSSSPYLWLLTIYLIIFTALQVGPPLLAEQAFVSRYPHATQGSPSDEAAQTTKSDGINGVLNSTQTFSHSPHYAIAIMTVLVTPALMLLIDTHVEHLFIAGALCIAYTVYTLFRFSHRLRDVSVTASATSTFPWLVMAFEGKNNEQLWAIIPITVVACATTWFLVFPPVEVYKKVAKVAAGVWLAGANIAFAEFINPAINEVLAKFTTISAFEAVGLMFLFVADVGLVLAAARRIIPRPFALLGLVLISIPFLHLLMHIGIPFMVAHMLLSIAWATLAGILVLSPKFKDVNSRLGIGLIIATLSVAKLILFDMDKLDGFVRALAFIICGLILLAMAVFGAKQQKGDRDRIGGASGPLLESDQSAASDRPVAGTPQADSWEMSPESNHRITGSSGSSRSSGSSQDSGTSENAGNTEQEPN